MRRVLTAWLGVAVLCCGCGEGEPAKKPGSNRIVYTDKTPEEWIELVQHKSGAARNIALDAIISYQKDGKDMVSQLTPLLKTASTDSRLAVARCLGEMGSDAAAAVPALAEALGDQKWRHRDGAAKSIGMIGANPDAAIAALVGALRDSDARVRGEAANALKAYADHADKIVPALVRALEDDDPFALSLICDGLRGLGPQAKQAVPALQKLANHPNYSVSDAAKAALRKIQGR